MFERREDSNTQTRYRIAHIPLFSLHAFFDTCDHAKKSGTQLFDPLSMILIPDLMLTL